ncbi:amidase [Modestobacter sp. DSM 44400]|uniref:amidase n=1 Tax=Modestobacter sp. DSM 44400 TaxID=1550230 RepID=UPI0011153494|nr:amidase [Modestobacter sp. DSM 44400]
MADPVASAVRALREAARHLDVDGLLPTVEETGVDRKGLPRPMRPAESRPRGVADALARARSAIELGAFVALYEDAAANLAAPGPLQGLPVAIKDNIDVAGQRVGNGTTGSAARVAPTDAVVWQRLTEAGGVLIGRTRMHELAWGVLTPGCRNPHDLARGTGGSSGGSAAAVAAGIVRLALGTDTGGSIRIPAALCGVAGLRPTAGAVPMQGVSPLAPSLDTVGPIARTAADCLLAHQVLSALPHSAPAGTAGLRVGRLASECTHRVAPAVQRALQATAARLSAAGVEVVDVELTRARLARPASYVIMMVEAATHWATPELLADDALTPETAALLRAGAGVLGTDYVLALRVAAQLRRDVDAMLRAQRLAALLLPSVPVTAAPPSADTVGIGARAEPVTAAYSRLTALASVTGHPALSVPVGADGDGLPVGAQLIGPRHSEADLCQLGSLIERPRWPRPAPPAHCEQ